MEIFIDDIALGTGDASDNQVSEGLSFQEHLTALDALLTRARAYHLRFKLVKCHFAQLQVELLGSIVGLGTVSACPKKVQGIVDWPRPSRREDVERFLATCSYIRAHLSPEFSNVSKPLRDVLAELHEARSQGKAGRKLPKGAPHPPASEIEPDWWKEPQAKAFATIKAMVSQAVELNTPDFSGAASGRNPFHVFLDASGYGVGAGLFQAPAAEEPVMLFDGLAGKKSLVNLTSFYETLGVPTNATVMEVNAAAQAKRKLLLALKSSARRTLSNKLTRDAYDAQLGLARSRKDRNSLNPLGLFSHSLSKAQQNWTTWERELLAAVLSLEHFASIVGGSTVFAFRSLEQHDLNASVETTCQNVAYDFEDRIHLSSGLAFHTGAFKPCW